MSTSGQEKEMQKSALPAFSISGGNIQIIPNPSNCSISMPVFSSNLDNELLSRVKQVRDSVSLSMPDEDIRQLDNGLEVITTELIKPAPRKDILQHAIDGLKGLKGTAEFAAALAALIQFVQTLF